jgi:hypothetical protein
MVGSERHQPSPIDGWHCRSLRLALIGFAVACGVGWLILALAAIPPEEMLAAVVGGLCLIWALGEILGALDEVAFRRWVEAERSKALKRLDSSVRTALSIAEPHMTRSQRCTDQIVRAVREMEGSRSLLANAPSSTLLRTLFRSQDTFLLRLGPAKGLGQDRALPASDDPRLFDAAAQLLVAFEATKRRKVIEREPGLFMRCLWRHQGRRFRLLQ